MSIVWDEELTTRFWHACRSCMDMKTTKILEQTIRKGTGTDHLIELNSGGCCGGHDHDHSDDRIGRLLHQHCQRTFFVDDHLIRIAERASKVVQKILTSEKKMSVQEMASIQRASLGHAIVQSLHESIVKESIRVAKMSNRDGGRLAIPLSFKEVVPGSRFVRLDSIDNDTMRSLEENMFAFQAAFLSIHDDDDNKKYVEAMRKDLDWIDMNSLMSDQSTAAHRNDKTLWITLNDLQQPDNYHGLRLLLQKLTSLPFELNAKAQYGLTICNDVLLSIYGPKTFFRRHSDNPGGDGRFLTIFYFVDLDEDSVEECECKVTVWKSSDDTRIFSGKVNSDSCLIVKCKDLEWAVENTKGRTGVVIYWCHNALS